MNLRAASVLGILSSCISSICLFVVFRVSIETLGIQTVGLWVITQSIFFVSRVADGGVGLNLTRAYAIDKISSTASAKEYYFAGLLMVALPVLAIGIILILPAYHWIPAYLKSSINHSILLELLIFSLTSSVIASTGSMGMALVEGSGRLTTRHLWTILSTITLTASVYPLTIRFGVLGLALSNLLSSSILAVSSFSILYRDPTWSVSSKGWPHIIRVNLKHGLSTTGMVLLRTSFEPWTKFLLGATGGLSAVAAFELAYRATSQVRILIQSAVQPLLVLGARTEAKLDDNQRAKFESANKTVVEINWLTLSILASAAPLISFMGFGESMLEASLFIILLAIGNSINSMGVIGYYAHASSGSMKTLLKIHLWMTGINITMGLALSATIGAIGAVLAITLCFSFGGIALLKHWSLISSTNIYSLLSINSWPPALACIITMVMTAVIAIARSEPTILIASSIACALIAIPFMVRCYSLFLIKRISPK